MNIYKYRIYHDDDQCSKQDRIRSSLAAEQLEHEYDSINTALHLYSRTKNLDISYDIERSQEGGALVTLRYFDSEQEADKFIGQFPEWLKNKLERRFCPVVKKVHA